MLCQKKNRKNQDANVSDYFFWRFVLCTPVNRNQLQLLAAACILLRLVAFSFEFDNICGIRRRLVEVLYWRLLFWSLTSFFFKLQFYKCTKRWFSLFPCLCISMLFDGLVKIKIELESRLCCNDILCNVTNYFDTLMSKLLVKLYAFYLLNISS